jgi:hypothetical protein
MILLIVSLIIYIIFYKKNEGFNINNNIELVISRYQENLDWINELPQNLQSNITIYNKGDNEINLDAKIIKLPNYGRESHTYLYHVINNYNNLADFTFFLPGSVKSRDYKWKQLQTILNNLDNSSLIVCSDTKNVVKDSYDFKIDKWEVTNPENRKKNSSDNLVPAGIRPYGKWFKSHFPNEEIKCISYNGVMLVKKEDILKRSKEFYMNLFKEHLFENTEVVHYSERSWKNIFSISDKNLLY